MSLPTFYAQEMLDLHNKYNLSENARTLLRAHDQWRMGQISQEDLGRMVKMSPKMRQAIIDTITKVNNTMKKKPEEQKMCIEIIQACTDLLTALGKCLYHLNLSEPVLLYSEANIASHPPQKKRPRKSKGSLS